MRVQGPGCSSPLEIKIWEVAARRSGPVCDLPEPAVPSQKKTQKATTRPGCQTPGGRERETQIPSQTTAAEGDLEGHTYHHTGPIFRLFTPRGRSPGSTHGTPNPQAHGPPQLGPGPRPVCLGPSHSNGPESQGFIFYFFKQTPP